MRIHTSRELLDAVLASALLALFVRTFLVQAWAVPTSSMERTVLPGDQILVNRAILSPRAIPLLDPLLPRRPLSRGDVLVFQHPEDPRRDLLKRAVGLPGDSVELAAGRLLVNGRPEPDPPGAIPGTDSFGPVRVPAGAFFALGDNRTDSGDSRRFGTVPLEAIHGRAVVVTWSFIEEKRRGPVGWLRATRWHRLFTPIR